MASAQPHADWSDEQLFVHFKAGEQAAFSLLYQRHGGNLLGFFVNRSCTHTDAADLAHDVWLQVIRKAEQFHGGRFRAWLFTIAINRLRDWLTLKLPDTVPASWNPPSPSVDPLSEQLLSDLLECLQSLTGGSIEVLRARLAGDGVTAIAAQYGISEATVYTRIHRAKQLVEDCMKAKES